MSASARRATAIQRNRIRSASTGRRANKGNENQKRVEERANQARQRQRQRHNKLLLRFLFVSSATTALPPFHRRTCLRIVFVRRVRECKRAYFVFLFSAFSRLVLLFRRPVAQCVGSAVATGAQRSLWLPLKSSGMEAKVSESQSNELWLQSDQLNRLSGPSAPCC